MIRIALAVLLATSLSYDAMAQTASAYGVSRVTRRTSPSNFTSRQMTGDLINRSLPQGTRMFNQGLLSSATGATSSQGVRSKSFAQVKQGVSSSPYMGLLATDPFSSTNQNYMDKVRPQIQRQQQEQQRAKEQRQLQYMRAQQLQQHQLTEAAAEGPYDVKGSDNMVPTGHVAAFMNNGGIYGNNGGYFPKVEIRSVRARPQQKQ